MQDSKNIKYVIARTLLFFFLLGLFFTGMSYVLQNKVMSDDLAVTHSEKPLINLQKEPENTIDLVVLGNSLCFTSISPKKMEDDFDYNTWVCGQPGELVQTTYHSLETVYETQNPSVIFVETNMMFDKTTETESWKESVDVWLRFHFPFIRFHDLWKTYIVGKTYEPNENYHGFEKRTWINPYRDGPYMKVSDEVASFQNNSQYYVKKMQELCREHGTRLVLYSCPSPQQYSYAIHNALTGWCEEQDIEYIDLNLLLDEIGINWDEDALDGGDHLNYTGALKVTEYMGRYLQQQ